MFDVLNRMLSVIDDSSLIDESWPEDSVYLELSVDLESGGSVGKEGEDVLGFGVDVKADWVLTGSSDSEVWVAECGIDATGEAAGTVGADWFWFVAGTVVRVGARGAFVDVDTVVPVHFVTAVAVTGGVAAHVNASCVVVTWIWITSSDDCCGGNGGGSVGVSVWIIWRWCSRGSGVVITTVTIVVSISLFVPVVVICF